MNGGVWGELPAVEGTMQVTRSMLDMRTAKPFVSNEEQSVTNVAEQCSADDDRSVCSYTKHNISLLEYIKKAEEVLINEETIKSDIQIPQIPSFKTTSISSCQSKLLTKICKNNSECSSDLSNNMENNLMKGIATMLLSYDYDSSTSSALRVLTDVAKEYLEVMCKSLRQSLDHEALTGQTGFFDSVDQVFHDMGIGNIHDIKYFYEKHIVDYHDRLVAKSQKLDMKLQTLSNKLVSKPSVKVKQEPPSRSGWTPIVANNNTHVEASLKNQWHPFVKTEPAMFNFD